MRLKAFTVRLTPQEYADTQRGFFQHEVSRGVGNARKALAAMGFMEDDDDLELLQNQGSGTVPLEVFVRVVTSKKRQFARARRHAERNSDANLLLKDISVTSSRRQRTSGDSDDRNEQQRQPAEAVVDRASIDKMLASVGLSGSGESLGPKDVTVAQLTALLLSDQHDGLAVEDIDRAIWATPDGSQSHVARRRSGPAAELLQSKTRHTIGGISFDLDDIGTLERSEGISSSPNHHGLPRRRSRLGFDGQNARSFVGLRGSPSRPALSASSADLRQGVSFTPHAQHQHLHGASLTPSRLATASQPDELTIDTPLHAPLDRTASGRSARSRSIGGDSSNNGGLGPPAAAVTPGMTPQRDVDAFNNYGVVQAHPMVLSDDDDDDDESLGLPDWARNMPPAHVQLALRGEEAPRALRPISREAQDACVGRLRSDASRRRAAQRAADGEKEAQRLHRFSLSPVTPGQCLSLIEKSQLPKGRPATASGPVKSTPQALVKHQRPPFDLRPSTADDRLPRQATRRAASAQPQAMMTAAASPTAGALVPVAESRGPPSDRMRNWLRGGQYAAPAAAPIPKPRKKRATTAA